MLRFAEVLDAAGLRCYDLIVRYVLDPATSLSKELVTICFGLRRISETASTAAPVPADTDAPGLANHFSL
jgi:hypothetical protein